MSARHPSTVRMSLEEFSRHGGLSGANKDGWGLAWYDEREVCLIKEALPAAESHQVRCLQDRPFVSPLVISHVRKATRGAVARRNCQPCVRELGGVWHTFAHNGDLPGIEVHARSQRLGCRPVGETDSEQAFCLLLDRLRPLWSGDAPPAHDARWHAVEAFAGELRELGPANFLYSDGDALFAHADRRIQSDRTIRPPGLWWLTRHCAAGGELTADGLRIEARGQEQEVVLLASVPLTAENWLPLARGEVSMARAGRLQSRPV